MISIRRGLASGRPPLASILPKKKPINRLLFDQDSRLAYNKILPILESIYIHLDDPSKIKLPSYTQDRDLMSLRGVLQSLRLVTHSVNRNLVDLENELVEQAAELGNHDAISMLAFETLASKDSTKDDLSHAQKLLRQLTDQKHPLSFKLAGDFAFSKNYHEQAAQYWQEFLDLEDGTILASQVHLNLGVYFYHYFKPKPNLRRAKLHLEKAVKFGELDTHIVKAHFFLGQLYSISDPKLSRHHMELASSRGLAESFPALGFLELNVFDNIPKALEWFKLGVEASNDLSCLVGQFDAHIRAEKTTKALNVLANLQELLKKVELVMARPDFLKFPDSRKLAARSSHQLLRTFFDTRGDTIRHLKGHA